MADTDSPFSGTPSGTPFGVPMVQVPNNGIETLTAGLSVAEANELLELGAIVAAEGNFIQNIGGTWTNQSAAQVVLDLLPYIYPVGCLYFSTNSTNPVTSLGFGTWAAFGAGKVPVGFLTADPDFGTDEAIGGEKTHVLTTAELANHPHNYTGGAALTTTPGVNNRSTAGAASLTAGQALNANGSDAAHNNLQPFVVVRIWKRTA